MKTDFKFNVVLILLALSCFLLLFNPFIYAQQEKPVETEIQDLNEDTVASKPGSKNIKDKIALYVFLVWVWIAIFVSIYFLRLKIIEVDRLFEYRFFQNIKEKK
jgi:hypothetical protein